MTAEPSLASESIEGGREAGRYLPAWTTGDLPTPPPGGWRIWVGLIGPGVVLAGTSIGSGEWLFGPAVTAQYGAALLWLALLSILLQAFCNLAMMRYAVYSGEPIIVGGLRTWPGPAAWMGVYLILDIAAIWPYNASNAAVPLAAVLLGHLPQTPSDHVLVKALGFTVFVLAFVPLIFGGTVYRMLEKIMTAKLVLVLGYLSIIAVAMVSWPVVKDVAAGFLRFGTLPLRAQSIVIDRQFSLESDDGPDRVRVQGTWELDGRPTGDVLVMAGTKPGRYDLRNPDAIPAAIKQQSDQLLAKARELSRPGFFFVRTSEPGLTLEAEGSVIDHHLWHPSALRVSQGNIIVRYDRPVPSSRALCITVSQLARPRRSRIRGHRGLPARARSSSRPELDEWSSPSSASPEPVGSATRSSRITLATRAGAWARVLARSPAPSAAARSGCRTRVASFPWTART